MSPAQAEDSRGRIIKAPIGNACIRAIVCPHGEETAHPRLINTVASGSRVAAFPSSGCLLPRWSN